MNIHEYGDRAHVFAAYIISYRALCSRNVGTIYHPAQVLQSTSHKKTQSLNLYLISSNCFEIISYCSNAHKTVYYSTYPK